MMSREKYPFPVPSDSSTSRRSPGERARRFFDSPGCLGTNQKKFLVQLREIGYHDKHVSNSLENNWTLWKVEDSRNGDGRMEGIKRALPIFHPSILPFTKGVKKFLKHANRREFLTNLKAMIEQEVAMLTEKQITEYHQKGYTVYPNFLTPDEVAELLTETEKITRGNTLAKHDKTRMEMEPDQPPDGARVRRLYEPCTYYPLFRALSESDKLLDTVEQLVGPDILFHYSKLNMKPPEIGSVVEWHQDLSYYPLTNRDSLAVLFYLDDADAENGCLQMIPDRHEGHLLEHTRNGYFQGRVTETVDASKAELVGGKSGTTIFMHCMTPHASTTNRSNRYRRTLILSYRAADAFPIFCGEMTLHAEAHVRLVRGRRLQVARFTMTEFPTPRYKEKSASLYELQERSRKEENG